MHTIHLEPHHVPSILKGGYSGKKFKLEVTSSVHIPADAGTWSGGGRSIYYGVRMSDGERVSLVNTTSAPWDESRTEQTITLRPGFVVVKSTIFNGKDMGLTFYARKEDIAPLIPQPTEDLTSIQQLVLDYTKSRKSSYNGQDRYDMAKSDNTYSAKRLDPFPARTEWDAAKAELTTLGMFDKRGAITVYGKNKANFV